MPFLSNPDLKSDGWEPLWRESIRQHSSIVTMIRHFSSVLLQWKSQAEMNVSREFSTSLQGDDIIELHEQTTVLMTVKKLDGWMK